MLQQRPGIGLAVTVRSPFQETTIATVALLGAQFTQTDAAIRPTRRVLVAQAQLTCSECARRPSGSLGRIGALLGPSRSSNPRRARHVIGPTLGTVCSVRDALDHSSRSPSATLTVMRDGSLSLTTRGLRTEFPCMRQSSLNALGRESCRTGGPAR
jgi:hypothetical protein